MRRFSLDCRAQRVKRCRQHAFAALYCVLANRLFGHTRMIDMQPILRKFQRGLHDLRCRQILTTAPLLIRDNGVKILSMVCHRDLIMYLVAAKSFYKKLGFGSFIVIDDGSLTASDRKILEHHLSLREIIHKDVISTVGCPKGGTWERLLKILDLTNSSYVIQLDADTLTLGPIEVVKQCVQDNASFTLGTREGQFFVSVYGTRRKPA